METADESGIICIMMAIQDGFHLRILWRARRITRWLVYRFGGVYAPANPVRKVCYDACLQQRDV